MKFDRCIDSGCDNIAMKVPLINGDSLDHFCNIHLDDARKSIMADLGQDCFNFIFSSFKHDLWFWGTDIKVTLSVAIDDYFETKSRDIYGTSDDEGLAATIAEHSKILRIKAKEYDGAIEMSKQDKRENAKMVEMWVGREYVDAIGGPLGKETHKIMMSQRGILNCHETFHHLVCLVLSAKRAERYIGHEFEEQLIGMETALWQDHRQHIN